MKTNCQIEAETYVKAICDQPPNAWGQIIIDGMQSHYYMIRMSMRYGIDQTQRAIDRAFAHRKRRLR